MNKKIFIFICIFSFQLLSSETEKISQKESAEKFIELYNSENYNEIYNYFTLEMKKKMNREAALNYLSDFRIETGLLGKRKFLNFKNSYASYLVSGETKNLLLEISTDKDSNISGIQMKQIQLTEAELPKLKRNLTNLDFPVKGEWLTLKGSGTETEISGPKNKNPKFVFDFTMRDAKGKAYRTDGKSNEDYYAFSQKIYSPCDGQVIYVNSGAEDNTPGTKAEIGNEIVIRTENNEYLSIFHFQKDSIQVKKGQKLGKGQLIGLCGNSGNSSEAHIGFCIQNGVSGTGVSTVKAYFEELKVNGRAHTDYSPIKGDKIQRP